MITENISINSNMRQYRRGLRYLNYLLEENKKVFILLKHDKSHISDKDAVMAMIETDLRYEPLGYVGNKEEEIVPGHSMASDIVNWVKKNTKVGEEGYRYPNGVVEKIEEKDGEYRITASVKVDLEKEDEGKDFKILSKELEFPKKYELINEFARGTNGLIECRLTEDEEDLVFTYKGEIIGAIEDKESRNYLFHLLENSPVVYLGVNKIDDKTILVDFDTSGELIVEVPSEDEILSIIDGLVSENIVSKEEALARKSYLEKYGVSKIAIKRLFKSYFKYDDAIAAKIPSPRILYIDNNGILPRAISYINAGKNLLFEGERGTGKNVLTETIAWLYNRPLYEFPLNSQHSNSSIFGSQTFKRVNDETELIFMKSSIIEAFEVGGIIVLDEFNTALAHVMTALNGLLDHRRRIYVPNYGNVNGHKNFIAIATQNKGYQGTFSINEGTMDRFVPIIFPNTVDIKSIIEVNVANVDRKTLNICQRLFEGIKNSVIMGELEENALSVRGFIDACMVLDQGVALKDALIDNIANRAIDLDDRESIKEMIKLQVG